MTQLTAESVTSSQRTIITITVMLVTIIEILDMTIVNVALPPMMGQLGANTDQITWVLTSYIVSSAIIMPLTGFLVARLGRKKLLLIAITGFLVTSMVCGASTSLAEIVLFRTLQGVFGASLVPLSQYTLTDIYPKKDLGKAMAIWGIGIMIAPVIGPTLGGYITANMSWRWVFYINVPVCLIALALTLQFIPDTPKYKEKIDKFGLLLMALGIGCLQIFLDRGNTNDWFHSKSIVILTVIWVFALAAFIVRGLRIKEKNIINLGLLKDCNLSMSTLILALFGASLFGVTALLPIMLEHLMGYTAELAGLFMLPRAVTAAIGMICAARWIKKFDPRLVVGLGIIISIYGTWGMCQYNLHASFYAMVWPIVITGFGNGLFFVPLTTAALSSFSGKDAAEGSGIFNFGRNLGGSIGISVLSTLVTREAQKNWNQLSGHLSLSNYAMRHWMNLRHDLFVVPQKLMPLLHSLERQSTMIAFIDAYYAVIFSFIIMIPLIFFMKKVDHTDTPMGIH